MTGLICFENVSKAYQMGEITVRALRNVNLAVADGEFVMIMGPSGSGKSTALNLIGGLDRPTDGKVIVDGEVISDYDNHQLTRYRRDKVGVVFQFFNLIPTLTAAENVELALTLRSNRSGLRGISRELLDRVGLAERADHFPAQLSGGEQQRVAIARALANHPRVLLCDEPTGSVDEETGLKVLEVIQALNREEGTTIVLVTHDVSLGKYADRVLHMHSGQIDHIDEREQAPASILAAEAGQ
jgi:putative ABC transport system ATP-binding protein